MDAEQGKRSVRDLDASENEQFEGRSEKSEEGMNEPSQRLCSSFQTSPCLLSSPSR